jgi:hypothetical protein
MKIETIKGHFVDSNVHNCTGYSCESLTLNEDDLHQLSNLPDHIMVAVVRQLAMRAIKYRSKLAQASEKPTTA